MDIAIQAAIAGILLLSLMFAGRASNERSVRLGAPMRETNPSRHAHRPGRPSR
jgi:hypothetical protein